MTVASVDGQKEHGHVRLKECTKRQAKKDDLKEWTASIPKRVNSQTVYEAK